MTTSAPVSSSISSRVRPLSPMSRPFLRFMSVLLREAASMSTTSNNIISSSSSRRASSGANPRPMARTISGPLRPSTGSPTVSTATEPFSESMSSRTSASASISRIVSPPSPMRTPMRSCGIFTCCIRSATGWVRLRPWSASTGWVVPPTHAGSVRRECRIRRYSSTDRNRTASERVSRIATVRSASDFARKCAPGLSTVVRPSSASSRSWWWP